jgi:hypothetical protein
VTPADEARKIQRMARAAHWLRVTIHLTGSAALFTLGWQRGVDAIPVVLALLAPNIILGGLLLRFGGELRTYGQYVGLDPHHVVRCIAAAARQRQRDPHGPLRDALWWLYGYTQNVTLSLAVAFAVDALGGPLPLGIAGVCALLTLTGIKTFLDLRMRLVDALVTFTLAAHGAADDPARPTEGN